MFTSVILKEDILDQRYVLVWKHHTQVLDVRPPKSTSKTTALRRLYKKNASKCGLSQASFLALCVELETYLYPKNHERRSTEAEHSVFGPYVNPWQNLFTTLDCTTCLILDIFPPMIQRRHWSHAAKLCFELMGLLKLTCSGESSS